MLPPSMARRSLITKEVSDCSCDSRPALLGNSLTLKRPFLRQLTNACPSSITRNSGIITSSLFPREPEHKRAGDERKRRSGGRRSDDAGKKFGERIAARRRYPLPAILPDYGLDYFPTICGFSGPSIPRSSLFSASGTLNLFRAATRSSTSALKSASLIPIPLCAVAMSLPLYLQGPPVA